MELKKHAPFHLDLLPEETEARELLGRHGFETVTFRDDPLFYLVVAENRESVTMNRTIRLGGTARSPDEALLLHGLGLGFAEIAISDPVCLSRPPG